MSWRPADSIKTLKSELDALYPGWQFLGFIGDQAHANSASDHNPNSAGVVTAIDIGPGGGLNIHALADQIATSPHPDLKYIISNKRTAEWQDGFKWKKYTGKDPHDTHIHISVGRGSDGRSKPPYDTKTKWLEGDEMTGLEKHYYDIGVNAAKDRWDLQIKSLQAQLAEVKKALANEKAKPAKEVIKEVVKIVEKPVYTHDEATAQNVSKILGMVTSIYEYFAGQYKTFSKYIKK